MDAIFLPKFSFKIITIFCTNLLTKTSIDNILALAVSKIELYCFCFSEIEADVDWKDTN